MYKLNKKSNAAKFYSWIWNKDVTTFKTMCPYFWGYVITILFLPFILVGKFLYYLLPKRTKVNKVLNNIPNIRENNWLLFDRLERFFKWVFIVFLSILAIFAIVGFVYILYKDFWNVSKAIGISVLVFGVFILLVLLFTETKILKILWMPFKFIGNMIYSLYKNICPLIKWE